MDAPTEPLVTVIYSYGNDSWDGTVVYGILYTCPTLIDEDVIVLQEVGPMENSE